MQLLLSHGADVNCYFRVVSNTLFPTALQYCLSDHIMMRLLLNGGYQAYKYVCGSVFAILAPHPMTFQRNRAILHHRCFQCCHGDDGGMHSRWIDLRNRAYQIYSQPDVVTVGPYDLHLP